MDITVHTGCAGDKHLFRFSWFDHNNVVHNTHVEVNIAERDKPRTLEVFVDGSKVAVVSGDPQIGFVVPKPKRVLRGDYFTHEASGGRWHVVGIIERSDPDDSLKGRVTLEIVQE